MESLKSKVIDEKAVAREIIIDKSLNNIPISPAAQKKNDEARAFLEKHPIPKDLFKRM